MSKNNCAVYMHVNLINGKRYIGITTQEPEMRWQNGHGYYNNAHFKNAILKYGWDNFGHFVLYKNIPINIAKNIEEMLIKEHFTHDPRFGYNKTMGGELEIPTEETRKKISEKRREYLQNHPEANPMYGKTGDNHPRFGKHHSEETREAISKALSKPVEAINPETGERVYYFSSTIEAGRAGFDQSSVAKCCNKKPHYKTHAGYIWRYVEGGDNDGGDNRG